MTIVEPDCIAIIGMAGRFPGAASVDAFWENLRHGVESITHFSDRELLEVGVPQELLRDERYVGAAATLDGIDLFDASLFNLSPAEAEIMDPQHRLFLECALESLENAGYSCDNGKQRIGVYAGTGINRYLLEEIDRSDLMKTGSGIKIVTGNDKDYLTARVSYKLGLTGPSICVQTACSTSLVAVHLACRSLLDHQTDIALAGGITIRVPQLSGYLYEEGGILSPDGHCRAFDAQAGGTIFGSGVGLVVLKRLEEAIADRDNIRAVIRGSAVNNDGSAKAGFTAPSVLSQAELISEALVMANVNASSISYVEAHGTGTNLGDPIEIAALTRAYRGWTKERGFCAVGSVKTNVGHLDTAAGVTGLIKTVLALEHRLIPPSLNFHTPNPEIDFESSPFYVNTTLREWADSNTPRRAGVSSFGLGGTNCHMIVEEAPPRESRGASRKRSQYLIPVSAKSGPALEQMCDALERHLSQVPETRLDDIAFTYQVGRKTYPHRRVLIAGSRGQAIKALQNRSSSTALTVVEDSLTSPVAFLFPGQGSQFANMGSELYGEEPVFRSYVDAASDILKNMLARDLRMTLFPARYGNEPNAHELQDTSILQPALFTVEYALAQLWQSWGVRPEVLLGHSIGEYVAAALAGVMSFEEGLRIIARRGALISSLPPGMMLACALGESDVLPLLGDDLSIAALNGSERTVVSGPPAAVLELEAALSARGITSHRLATSHAFHSRMMEPVVEQFRDALRAITLRPPQLQYISNVTGTWITAADTTDPEYWVRHLLQPVRFYDGLRTLATVPRAVLLEVGPGRVLTGLAKSGLRGDKAPTCLVSMPELKEEGATEEHLHRSLAELWLAGARVDWGEYQKDSGCGRLPLPGYAFQRSRYWVSEKESSPSLKLVPANVEPGGDELNLLVPMWRKLPEPTTPSNSSFSASAVTLVFYEEPGPAREIVDGLRLDGMEVVRVRAGATFQQLNEAEYCIDSGEPKEYAALFSALAPRLAGRRLRIVHLLTLRGEGKTQEDHVRPFYSLIWIAQAIGLQLAGAPVELVIVSEGVHVVTGAETLVPENALIAGPFNAIPREYPGCAVRWIDADLSEATIAAIRGVISDEGDSSEAIAAYAYRQGKRYQRTLSELRLPEELAQEKLFRPGGVYLITGGLGEIGSATARVLASEGQAKLALLGRTALPGREQWDMSSREKLNPEVAQRIQTVLNLESLGSVVFPVVADVGDEAQMREAVRRIEASLGKIDGVIHAAGVAGGGLSTVKTMAEVEEVFNPKINGARVLARIFSDHQLDFFICCSSVQSLIGDAGQSAYSAANAFLDTFSHALSRGGMHPCLSINWDTWRDAGMAVKSMAADQSRGGSLSPESGISSADGASLMARLLRVALPQIVACRASFTPRLKEAMKPREVTVTPTPAVMPPAQTVVSHARPELFTPYIAPETPLQVAIAEVWQDVLGVNPIGLDDSLFELGGDSVAAIRVCQKIQENLGYSVTPAQLFSATTVRSISAIVVGLQPATVPNTGRSRGEQRRAKRLSA
ncbi:MAG: SDR family NAD(P)-dependent oxidoreductase [Acidobacteria bacterium]|nr:SDR family NAD(P)-dependent oxidoreductase [Acidobacteriota bacterium]